MPAIGARSRAPGSVSARTERLPRVRAGSSGGTGSPRSYVRAQLGERADGGDDRRHAPRERGGEHAGALDPAVGERDHARPGEQRGDVGLGHEAQVPADPPARPRPSARSRSGSIGMRGLPTIVEAHVRARVRRPRAAPRSGRRGPCRAGSGRRRGCAAPPAPGGGGARGPACSSACGITAMRSGAMPPTSTSRRSRLAAPCTITRSQLP